MTDVSSATSSTGAAIITSLGVGSGLNVSSIISQLMAVQDQPVTLLQNQAASVQSTVSAYGQLKSALSTFQTSVQSLSDISQYQSVSGSVANTAVATVSTTSAAAAGTYSLQVSQLAQSQTLVTAGQASTTSSIGNGTISFSFGTISGTAQNGIYQSPTTFANSGAAPKTVTIDSSDNSLSGIAAAINAANVGVTASILNDGSSNPDRLSLTVTNPGAGNSLSITTTGDAALGNLLNQDPTQPTGQNLTQTSAAQNAQFTLNGVAITSSSNTDSTVIPGVTLNLLSTNTTTPTTLNITKSTAGAVAAINSFVSAYNSIATTIQQATLDGSATQQAGPLQGQNSVLSIMTQMQALLDAPVPGAPSATSMMAQIGVGFSSSGTLTVDSTKLQAALTANPSAVSSLFASNGTATDTLVNYTGNTSSTKPGSYAVNITQLASQGSVTGSALPATTTITAGSNDTLTLDLDGTTANVTLAAGTYTPAQLATALQAAINSNDAFTKAGSSVTVGQSNGALTITSNSYGSSSIASASLGDGLASILGDSQTAVAGLDVAGTINGLAATGSGQTLTSSSGNSAGLAVDVLGGNLGARGVINYTQGYSNELSNLMTTVLGKSGQIAAATNGLNSTITSIQSSITSENAMNSLILANYQAEFSALDVTMSQLNSTSTFLTQQLAALASNSSSSS